MMALQGAILNLEFQITYKLQDMEYRQNDDCLPECIDTHMSEKVQELTGNFAVRQHLKYVDLYPISPTIRL